ncbi:MAG: trigger factor [Prolixibacteraceae bacterium]|nr:trigger factor [Prolixibacteraceae bacterium]
MNITKESIDELTATLTVKIEKNDYESSVNEVLKDYRKKANMPGFRPGKVPAGLVKKLYGKAAIADEVNKVLSNNLSKYIIDEKLNILGEPLPDEEKQKKIDWDNDENFEFVFDIATTPEFSIQLDKRNNLPFYKITADEKMIEKQEQDYTNQYGENKPVEKLEGKDTMKGNFVQLDENGNELEKGIKADDVLVAPDVMKDEEIKKEFYSKSKGDEIIVDLNKIYNNNANLISGLLKISKEEAEKIEGNFKFSISDILRFTPAKVNEDLFKKIYGEDTDIKTEDQFKAKIKEELEKNLRMSSDYKFSMDCREHLVEKTEFNLPENFLKRWIKETNSKLTEEQIEKDFDNFMKDLRWQLIYGKILKDNSIEIKEEEIMDSAKKIASMQFRQYGLFNIPESQLDAYAAKILENEEEKKHIENQVGIDKAIEFIKSKVTVEEKDISQDDFQKLMEK